MKKIFLAFICIFISFIFTSCQTVAENNEISSEQSIKTQTLENQSSEQYTVDTDFFTLTLPNNWKNDCFYEIVYEENHSYRLSFYEKESHEEDDCGWIFSISLFNLTEDYTVFPSYDILGTLDTYQYGSYNMIVLYPSDVQFSEKTAKKYNEMANCVSKILNTFNFKSNCSFTKYPTEN